MGNSDSKGLQWIKDHVPDLSGKLIVITGSNSGIGAEAAWILASRGARVVMACRNVEKAKAAVSGFVAAHPEISEASFDVMQLDLNDLESITSFAAEIAQRHRTVDVLVCNAGIMAVPLSRTKQGHEAQFGTNCLGHYALIHRMLPQLHANAPAEARVVLVSSGAHTITKTIKLEDLSAEKAYSPWARYAETKLGNLLMVTHLGKKLGERTDNNIKVLGCHPGYSDTNLQNGTAFEYANVMFAQSGFLGSLPTVMAATEPSLRPGDYIGPDRFGAWGLPVHNQRSKASKNQRHAQEVCDTMAEMAGLSKL